MWVIEWDMLMVEHFFVFSGCSHINVYHSIYMHFLIIFWRMFYDKYNFVHMLFWICFFTVWLFGVTYLVGTRDVFNDCDHDECVWLAEMRSVNYTHLIGYLKYMSTIDKCMKGRETSDWFFLWMTNRSPKYRHQVICIVIWHIEHIW